ncbi:MAG TPA: MFS transporter [Anaerolineae bacterium]|nr:MFS transporter [Anaerolineae bacterium]
MTEQVRPSGMRAFFIVWAGQIISLLGTAMTEFGLTIWAYEKTGKATPLALVGFFFVFPLIALSPFAGAIIDRSNRKLMMMLSDLVAGVVTIAQFILLATGRLEIWHLYVAAAITGASQAFQWPAFSAGITLMLPKEHLGRANGMMELAGSASNIFAPVAAGALLPLIKLQGIMLIDIVSFAVAVGSLLLVQVPQPKVTEAGRQGQGSLWKESGYGFRYILARPSLLGLQLVFMVGNFFSGLAWTVMAAMILARTGSNEIVYGTVMSAGAIGGVIGGAVMGAWGGTKRKVHGVLAGWALSSLLCVLPLGIGRGLQVWAVANFLGAFLGPIINGSNQAIWQAKVAPDVQGRVFSVRRMIAWSLSTLAMLLAGPLADNVLEPAMRAGGSLTPLFGGLVGTGPGAGMALLFVLGGLGGAVAGVGGYIFPQIRDAETILADYDLAPAGSPAAAQPA